MTKLYSMCALLAMTATTAIMPAFAANSGAAKAEIPFSFMVGKTEMQPGKYLIERVNGSPVFMISDVDGKRIAVMTTNVSGTSLGTEGMLSFVRDGNRYALAQIWLAGYQRANAVPANGTPAYQVAMVRQ